MCLLLGFGRVGVGGWDSLCILPIGAFNYDVLYMMTVSSDSIKLKDLLICLQ